MILLSFDIEEFDAPLEHGVELPFEEQMRTSVEGTRKILACLARHRVKATFFCTANFALHAKDLILDIQKGGHEIASHGFYHSSFETADLRKSKEALEELTGQPVNGFRMARMMPVEEEEIHKAGYLYNSSLNPTCIPGRYNHLGQPRTYFMKDGVLQLPASVTPIVRFPLFWLAYHNLPATLYRKLALYLERGRLFPDLFPSVGVYLLERPERAKVAVYHDQPFRLRHGKKAGRLDPFLQG